MATKIKPQDIAKIIALKAAMGGGRPGAGGPPPGVPMGPPPGMKKGGSVKGEKSDSKWDEKGRDKKKSSEKDDWSEEGTEKTAKFARGGSVGMKANGPRMGIESKGKTRAKIY